MYLKKVGATYYFYSRVPRDLISLLGKTEIKKSLKTKDRRTAITAAKVYALELEKLGMIARTRVMDEVLLHRLLQRFKDSYLLGVDAARDTGATVMDVLNHQAFSGKPIEGLDVNAGFLQVCNLFGDESESPEPDKAIDYYSRMINSTINELRTSNFSDHNRFAALSFVEKNNLDVAVPPRGWFDENDDLWFSRIQGDFLKIIRKLLQTQIDMYRTEIDRLQGNYGNPYDVQARNTKPPFMLTEAIDKYCAFRQQERPANERTQARYREYFNVMVGMLGDRDITLYTRQHLMDLKDQLYNRHANFTKNPKVKKPLDKRTVNTNYMGKICSLFSWLTINDFIDKDISAKLTSTLSAKEKRERKRKAYDNDDLKNIFGNLPFDPSRPYLSWVPLLAAYSGARQGEICQLLVSDIKEAHGIHYMHLTEEDDQGKIVKTLKNENSRRLVPIHPIVLRLGFLKYVERQKSEGKAVLFESRSLDRCSFKPLAGPYYSKLFQSFNRQYVTDDPKKVFHSLRHLVHNELKQAGVSSEVYHSITGHTPQQEMDVVYTEDYKLSIKYNALKLLKYPLDLKTLHQKFRIFL